ncbi:MAG: hypothetical protein LBC41_03320 [Clostridiales bacterium]|nr:hypothetical protein [Clostridiales bacterium]
MAALIQTAFEALFKKAKRAASLPREKANSAASLPALPPMKRSDFLKIKAQFEKRGGHILQGPQASLILDSQGANGATSLDGKTIFLRDNPAASTVYEELAHSRQLSSGRFDGTLECLLALEVEAKALILWRSKSLGLSDAEVEYVKSLMAEDVKSLAAEKDCKKAG